MKFDVPSGRYVLAVSGGVDSMVLLDLFNRRDNIDFAVAHFDHGIRLSSHKDADFVRQKAKSINRKFYCEEGNLGRNASEERARIARYHFLESVRQEINAIAIVTAHHQDDLIETAIINTIRGTGRKGLSSLQSHEQVIRPLLEFPKREVVNYAVTHNLEWVEDETNRDNKYLRNYIRQNITQNISADNRKKLLDLIGESAKNNDELDILLSEIIPQNNIDRRWLISLPHRETKEVLAELLRWHKVPFDKSKLEALSVALKTKSNGSSLDITKGWTFVISGEFIYLVSPNSQR